jgi:hypothetical protein
VHDRRPGAGLDRVARAYTDLLDAVQGLAVASSDTCGWDVLLGDITVLEWVDQAAQGAFARGEDVTDLDAIHALTEHLVLCWSESVADCVAPSPGQLRALQGIRAALIRYKALDTARERSGKDTLSSVTACGAGGYVRYRYDSGDGTQISATLDLLLGKDPDGRGLTASDASSYRMSYASVTGGTCPSSEYGQTSLALRDAVPDTELVPELQVDLDDERPSVWFTPIWYGHWADCHDAGSGWQTVALACDAADPSGSDSLTATWGPGREALVFDCTSPDGTASTSGAVYLTGSLDWLIPADLWD